MSHAERILQISDGIVDGPTSTTLPSWDDLRKFLGEGRNRYPVSYVIFTDGTDSFAQNGDTGAIDYGGPDNEGSVDGADPTAVAQAALDNLTAGRDWRERIVVKGDYTLDSPPVIPAFTSFELRGRLTLADNADVNLIEIEAEAQYVEIFGGHLDGNKTNQTLPVHNISIGAGAATDEQIWIHDMQIYDAKGDGINAEGGLNNVIWIYRNRIGGNDRHGLGLLSVADSFIFRNQIGWSGVSGINIGSGNNDLTSNFVWYSGQDGIYVGESGNTLLANRVDSCDRAGIYLGTGIDHISISKHRLYNNGQDAGELARTRSAIYLSDGVEALIDDNFCFDDQGSPTQQYGMFVFYSATPVSGTIKGNSGSGNVVAFLGFTGTHSMDVHRNPGYVTENSGTAVISNGATVTGNIAHGLAGTPTIVIPGGRDADTEEVRCSSRDGTNIVLSVTGAVGGDRTVDWYAIYSP